AAVTARILGRIEERLVRSLARGGDPLARLERWLDELVDLLADHPTYARLLLRSLFEDDDLPGDTPGELEAQRAIGSMMASDEARIAALRSQIDVDVPVDLHWTWNYASEVAELRALYGRGKRGQWNAEAGVDWSIPFPRDEWFLPRDGLQILPSVLASVGADD